MYYTYVHVPYHYFNLNKAFQVSLVISTLNIFMKYLDCTTHFIAKMTKSHANLNCTWPRI